MKSFALNSKSAKKVILISALLPVWVNIKKLDREIRATIEEEEDMLKGRESLIRLVGKRRRLPPNSLSLLSPPSNQGSLNLCNDKNDGSVIISEKVPSDNKLDLDMDNGTVSEPPSTLSVFVTCPVCENTVPDYKINSHLDTCCGRGTKRKMSQRTLFQLNFHPRPKIEDPCCSDYEESSFLERDSKNIIVFDNVDKIHNDGGAEGIEKEECQSISYLDNLLCNSGLAESPETMNLPLLLLENHLLKQESTEIIQDISRMVLKTFIVGRKFSDIKEINTGVRVTFLRDPDNIKDSNAIKVLYADSDSKVLGFLPREVAQTLSPLMDIYCLTFEGCITSGPQSSIQAVPIEIMFEKTISSVVKNYDDNELRNLWEKAVNAADSSKTHLLSTAKYQQNFSLILQEVLKSYSHIFTIDEKSFLESFFTLSDDSQRLFIRLYTRKGPWFRMSNISYSEILNCYEGVTGLSDTGYVYSVRSVSDLQDNYLKDILNLLSVSELREILSMLKKKHNVGSRKEELIAWLLSTYTDGLCPLLPNLILQKTGYCIRISSTAESLIWRAERLFFMNEEQDLSAFLLVDLGIIKYPTYNCTISNQIFSERSDLLAYEEALEVAQIMDQSLDENKTDLVLRCIEISDSRISDASKKMNLSSTPKALAAFFSCFSASWVYSKVVFLGVSFLERERRYVDAVTLLKRLLTFFTSDPRRGYWTLRLSIDLEHIGFVNESLLVCENGLLDSWVCAGSRTALQRRVVRLAKPPRRWKTPSFSNIVKRKITEVHVQGRPLNSTAGEKSRFYNEDGEQCGVEQVALQFYAGEGGGWQGIHTESGIWLTIFGVLMWEIIFSDVPDVFRTKFQTAPLDLETGCFYEARKEIINTLLSKIHNGMAEEILITSYELNFGTSCRGVNWDRHSLSELGAAVTCIGGPCLASLCRQLAQDYRSWSSGMPDLFLWRFNGDYKGEAKLVEVKGPRDKLSEQQRAWLLFLMDVGFNVEVCKVSPAKKG